MAEKRRQSMKVEVSRCLDSALSELQLIWDEIGIEESQRDERQNVVLLHLENLLSEMVREENEMRKRLLASVENCTKELAVLSRELGVELFQPAEGLSTLQVEKALRQRVDALKRDKKERMDKLGALKNTEQLLCDLLATTPMYIATGSIPTDEQLQALQTHIETLKADKAQREETFRAAKQSILSLMEQLEQEPNTSFERDVIYEEEETFSLSMENMNALKRLQAELVAKDKDNARLAVELTEEIDSIWGRLQLTSEELQKTLPVTGHKPSDIEILQAQLTKLRELKKANLRKVIDATREEIFSWWDRCFYGREQRNAFTAAYDDEYTEELLQKHDEELVRIKKYYEAHKTLWESVKRREEMFKQMLEFEVMNEAHNSAVYLHVRDTEHQINSEEDITILDREEQWYRRPVKRKKASDPNRFSNRGCVLLQEEKMRAKLNKDLPKLEKVLSEKIEQWEREHGSDFLVEGVRFVDYVEAQWAAHEQSKKLAKEQRMNARSKATEKEMKFGSRPTTPNKRRMPGTPTKTPKRMKGANGSYVSSPRVVGSTTVPPSPRSVGRPPRTGVSYVKTRPPKSPAVACNPALKHLSGSPAYSPKTPSKPNLPISSGTNENDSPNVHAISVHIPFPSPAGPFTRGRQRNNFKTTPKKLRNNPGRATRRKVLGEMNSRREEISFSTTMHTNSWKSGKNTSISSTGSSCPSYTDFTKHLSSDDKPYCLSSSIISSPQRNHSRVTGL